MSQSKYDYNLITYESFIDTLKSYKDIVPSKLDELEEQRLRIIPKALSERTDNPHLLKPELQKLVDWKLGHGTFRPSLRKLVESNSDETVKNCTRQAFETYKTKDDQWEKAITMLAKGLRGVGPATASLLLNTYDGEKVPFFSDELLRWVMMSDGRGNGWDRKIKYSIKEYRELYERVEALRKRLSNRDEKTITSVEVEMVAYVLGQRQVGGVKRKGSEVEDEEKVENDQVGEENRKRTRRS